MVRPHVLESITLCPLQGAQSTLYISLSHNNPSETTFTLTISGDWYLYINENNKVWQAHFGSWQKQWVGDLQNNW